MTRKTIGVRCETEEAAVRKSGEAISVEELLAAVVSVPGVRDARVNTSAGGDRTLSLDLAEGANELVVAERVAQVLDEECALPVTGAQQLTVAGDVSPTTAEGPRRRIRLERVQVATVGLECEVVVTLAGPHGDVAGRATGPASPRSVLQAVAVATLQAVDNMLAGRARSTVDFVDILDIGGDQVAVALLTLVTAGRTDRLPGAALIRGDARQAAARATLAALNRRLDTLLAIPPEPPVSAELESLESPLTVEAAPASRYLELPAAREADLPWDY